MSARAFISLTCDGDGCTVEVGPFPGGSPQARRAAKRRLGWGVAFNDDGLTVDLCGDCLANHERTVALARVSARQAARAAGLGNKWQ